MNPRFTIPIVIANLAGTIHLSYFLYTTNLKEYIEHDLDDIIEDITKPVIIGTAYFAISVPLASRAINGEFSFDPAQFSLKTHTILFISTLLFTYPPANILADNFADATVDPLEQCILEYLGYEAVVNEEAVCKPKNSLIGETSEDLVEDVIKLGCFSTIFIALKSTQVALPAQIALDQVNQAAEKIKHAQLTLPHITHSNQPALDQAVLNAQPAIDQAAQEIQATQAALTRVVQEAKIAHASQPFLVQATEMVSQIDLNRYDIFPIFNLYNFCNKAADSIAESFQNKFFPPIYDSANNTECQELIPLQVDAN